MTTIKLIAAAARRRGVGGVQCLRVSAAVPAQRNLSTHKINYQGMDGEDKGQGNLRLIYSGSLTAPIKSLKRVSITTCAMSIVGMPTLLFLGQNSLSVTGQVAVAGTAMLAAVGSTVLLHYCIKPYAHRMYEILPVGGVEEKPPEEGTLPPVGAMGGGRGMDGETRPRRFSVEMLDIWGRVKVTDFGLDEVEPQPEAMRPFVSFRAKGVYYFIQGGAFDEKGLLRHLLGRPLREEEK
ncbi:unnamed protein product [Discosporangium mesarthrocarpum]